MTLRAARHALVAVVAMDLLAACTIAPAPAGSPGIGDLGRLPPPGYGTLTQRQVSVSIVMGPLEVVITPLDESVTRVTAPDTHERLSGLAEAQRVTAPPGSSLFLVSFFSVEPDVRFMPEEIELVSRGVRLKPVSIAPITPGWGQGRLGQRVTETAVYAFAGQVDLESELIVAYGVEQSREWNVILPRIQAERARARARAGISSGDSSPAPPANRPTATSTDQVSSPYFEILR